MKTIACQNYFGRVPQFFAAGILTLSCVAAPSAFAFADDETDATSFPQVEQKVKGIKKRVRLLEAQVADLQTQLLPVEVNVDCTPGNMVSDALTAHADGTGLLTIRMSGTCTEAVVISRSNVRLEGQGAASTIQTPTTATWGIAIMDNVRNVELRNLTVNGGTAAVMASKGAHAALWNVIAQQASSGVMALDNGVLDVTGSTLRNNAQGVYAARGGVVSLSNSVVELNTIGVLSFKAGVINLTTILPDLTTASTGPVIRNNTNGAVARAGGYLELSDATIEGNQNYGVIVDSGSTLELFALSATGNRITGNGAGGILAGKNGSLVISDVRNTITANLRGIVCQPDTSYSAPPGFTVTGNTIGDIVGCTP